MKYAVFYVLVILSGYCQQQISATDHIPGKSEITEVTIGVNSAEVERSLLVKGVPAGSHTIIVDNLPNSIDENSVKVSGLGNAVIVSTVLQNKVTPRTNEPGYIDILTALKATEKSIADLSHGIDLHQKLANSRFAAVAQYVDKLLSKSTKDTTMASSLLSLPQLADTLDFQEKEQASSNARLAEIAALRRKVNEVSGCVQNMLSALDLYGSYSNNLSEQLTSVFGWPSGAELSPTLISLDAGLEKVKAHIVALPRDTQLFPPNRRSKELHINIHVPTAVEGGNSLQFDLTYMASPASWQAEYDLRLEKTQGRGEESTKNGDDYEMKVGLFAVVRQFTGEEWMNVHLHLSTSQAESFIHSPSPPTRVSLDFRSDQYFMKSKSSSRISASYPSSFESSSAAASSTESMPMNEFTMADVSVTGSSGQIGSPLVFHPEHVVNISSDARSTTNFARQHKGDDVSDVPAPTLTTHTTRLFIQESVIKPMIFTYIVPTSSSKTAHLKAWTMLSKSSDESDKNGGDGVQLMKSQNGRIFISGTFAGTTSVPASQPGSPIRLDLGLDKNIQLKSAAVLPHQNSRSEDKSTWFVTDKVKYLVENVEYAFSVHSSYDEPHLVLMSEYLPHVGEEGIKIELVQPPAKAIQSVIVSDNKKDSEEGDVWSEEEFLAAVLAHPSLQKPSTPSSEISASTQMLSFMSKTSGNLVWAKWVLPGETAKARLQYKIIWPEGKQIAKRTIVTEN